MKKSFLTLFFCLFVVMTGYGVTLPVLPYYIERMALFGLATNLVMFYGARVMGGVFSAAILPIAAAFVTDITEDQDRARGMSWLGAATSMGVVTGPILGAFFTRFEVPANYSSWYFRGDAFSIPFIFASILGFVSLGIAFLWFPKHRKSDAREYKPVKSGSWDYWRPSDFLFLAPLLALAFLDYFALAIFEGTFALHAKILLNFGPLQMGWVFVACGLVMALAQATLVPFLISHFGETPLVPTGFMAMGIGLTSLMIATNMLSIIMLVSLFALGVAFITPALASLVSKVGGKDVGKGLGQLTAATSLGQAAGPMMGGVLIGWQVHLPYLVTSFFLWIAVFYAIFLGRRFR